MNRLLLSLLLFPTLVLGQAPFWRNSWDTNVPPRPVQGDNTTTVSNIYTHIWWDFWGTNDFTIAHLIDVRNATNGFTGGGGGSNYLFNANQFAAPAGGTNISIKSGALETNIIVNGQTNIGPFTATNSSLTWGDHSLSGGVTMRESSTTGVEFFGDDAGGVELIIGTAGSVRWPFLTPSTLMTLNSVRDTVSFANGTGALTNDNAGGFGWFNLFLTPAATNTLYGNVTTDLNAASNALRTVTVNATNTLYGQTTGDLNSASNVVRTLAVNATNTLYVQTTTDLNSESNSLLAQMLAGDVWTNQSGVVHPVNLANKVAIGSAVAPNSHFYSTWNHTNDSAGTYFNDYAQVDAGNFYGFSEIVGNTGSGLASGTFSAAIYGQNNQLTPGGTDAAYYPGLANYGVLGSFNGAYHNVASNGEAIAVFGYATSEQSWQAGVAGMASGDVDGATNIGVMGLAYGPGIFTGQFVGGYLEVGGITTPTLTNAVLILENQTSGFPLIIGRSNTAPVFYVGADGNLRRIRNVPYTWPGANAAGALTNNGSGTLGFFNSYITAASLDGYGFDLQGTNYGSDIGRGSNFVIAVETNLTVAMTNQSAGGGTNFVKFNSIQPIATNSTPAFLTETIHNATVSTVTKFDGNKQLASIANGTGALTNDNAGNVAWFSGYVDANFATNKVRVAPGAGTIITTNYENGGVTYVVADTEVASTMVLTNFVVNQVYTNTSVQPILVRAAANLVSAAVNGDVALDLMYSKTGGTGYILLDRVARSTVVTGFAVSTTNSVVGVMTNLGSYYFTNTSAGVGNSAGLVDGTGQYVIIGGGAVGPTGAAGAAGSMGISLQATNFGSTIGSGSNLVVIVETNLTMFATNTATSGGTNSIKFNTAQPLTTAASPTFAALTISSLANTGSSTNTGSVNTAGTVTNWSTVRNKAGVTNDSNVRTVGAFEAQAYLTNTGPTDFAGAVTNWATVRNKAGVTNDSNVLNVGAVENRSTLTNTGAADVQGAFSAYSTASLAANAQGSPLGFNNALAVTNLTGGVRWETFMPDATRRRWGYYNTYQSGGISTVGENGTHSGTLSYEVPTTNIWRQVVYTTAATSNTFAAYSEGTQGSYFPGKDTTWSWVGRIDAIGTNKIRAWVGLTSNTNIIQTDSPTTLSVAAMRFTPWTNGTADANWTLVTCDGSGCTATPGTTAATTNLTAIDLIEDNLNSRWVALINGVPVATNITRLPIALMGSVVSIGTFSANAYAIRVQTITSSQGRSPKGNFP